MAKNYDWRRIQVMYEMGQTPYQISRGAQMPSKEGIRKRAIKEGWSKPDATKRLPIVADALSIDSTHLTDEVLTTVLGLISEGSPIELACRAAGIADRTWRDWQAADPTLKDLVHRARAGKVIDWLSTVDRAKAKDWKAATWLMQNSPDTRQTFGQQHHDNKLEVVINIDRNTDGVTIDGRTAPDNA